MIEWDDLDDDVKSLTEPASVGGKQMARETILNAVDPITAVGPRFSFDDRDPFEVPHPCARSRSS